MNKEIITNKQGISIVVLFIIGSATVLSPGGEAKQDVWIAVLLAVLMALPAIFIYARILSIFPGKDLFDILNEVFGKILGKIVALTFIWYAFHLGALVIRNFSEFIRVVSLPRTPQLIIVVFIGLICIWAVKAGVEVIGRWAGFFLPIILIFIAGTVTLSLTQADINNMKPILYNGFQPVIESGFSTFSFPFAETVVFMMFFCSVKDKFKTYKVYTLGIVGGAAILSVIYIRNILVLGVETLSTLYFPSYSAVSMVEIGTFLERIEIIVAVIFLLAGIVKIGICLYAASNGIAKVFNFDGYRVLAAPIGFLMMGLSCFIYTNTMEMFEWASKIYPYYAAPFQIILPVVILIASEIKVRIVKRK